MGASDAANQPPRAHRSDGQASRVSLSRRAMNNGSSVICASSFADAYPPSPNYNYALKGVMFCALFAV